jgi:hypothetical protein
MTFKRTAIAQASRTWSNELWLLPPNEFTLFDWPPDNPTVRPNIKCWLNCQFTEDPSKAHAIIDLISPRESDDDGVVFHSSTKSLDELGSRGGTWDIGDTGVHHNTAKQDPATFSHEDLQQIMVPHEVGHLLGLGHIGETQAVGTCTDETTSHSNKGWAYGDSKALPMWMARDIMGLGPVVHPCNALPWMKAMGPHTGTGPGNGISDYKLWIPAGTNIPPRAIGDIPKDNYTLSNSPYSGFEKYGKYKAPCDDD